MPDDALPQPWPTPLTETARLRRDYRDALGRPMRGTLTISGVRRTDHGDTVTVAAPVNVALSEGLLEVDLPPGDYTITGALHTIDGARVREDSTLILRPAP